MSLRKIFLSVYFLIAGLLLVMGSVSMYQSLETNNTLKNEIPAAIDSINKSARLDVVAQLIRYDDEVLTQSARNYAFTGDIKWKERYDKYVPLLDLRIKEALDKGDSNDKAIFDSVSDSNQKLITLETEAFNAVDSGDKVLAQKILDGAEYSEQKLIYKSAVDKYLFKRGETADQAARSSNAAVNDVTSAALRFASFQGWTLAIFLAVIILIWTIFYLYFVRRGIATIVALQESVNKVAAGDLNQTVEVAAKNEIGDLAVAYNKMTKDLKDSKENIEKKISERTADLEKLNQYMTGRELKMIELKKEIANLKLEINSKKNK